MAQRIKVYPEDIHNQELLINARPPDWSNPEPASSYNLVVVGAGTSGLVTALGAANMGAKVALVERHLLGGCCLNYGCVPSKAVIRSSRLVGELLKAKDLGIALKGNIDVDFSRVMERMRRLRTRISYHDAADRLRSAGVDVFFGGGQFTGKHSFEVEGKELIFRKAAITAGSRPVIPPIDGLQETGFLTNMEVFSLTEKPETLLVIGGGPIGCELAQAFNRLGSKVTIVQSSAQLLPREDREAAGLLAKTFQEEGIEIRLNSRVVKVESSGQRKIATIAGEEKAEMYETDEILVGVGRALNVEGLGLEAAGVMFDEKKGVLVNGYLQTSNRHIYAAGDIAFPYKFTHTAEATARIVIQNALFLKSKKTKSLIIPWCIYTDPEIAHVGMSEKDAIERKIPVETFTRPFNDMDRAILDGEEEGFIKVHIKKGTDKILGATIVARHAGEMISEITLAMAAGKGLKILAAGVIHPYPTQAEAIKQVASQYYINKFTPFLKRILERWFKWRR